MGKLSVFDDILEIFGKLPKPRKNPKYKTTEQGKHSEKNYRRPGRKKGTKPPSRRRGRL